MGVPIIDSKRDVDPKVFMKDVVIPWPTGSAKTR